MANGNFALGIGVVAGLGYLFTRMRDDKEEFREEEWYPRFYRERRALKKTRKQTKDAEMVYRKYKGRKGPALSATSVKRGTRKRGNDGNMWEVRKSGKSQRWFKGAESFEADLPTKEGWPIHSSRRKLCDDCESEYWPIDEMERVGSKYYGDCCALNEEDEESTGCRTCGYTECECADAESFGAEEDENRIGMIWFDDVSSYPQEVTFIEDVSDLVWGDASDDREPYTIEETIERLREMVNVESEESFNAYNKTP